MQQQADVGIGHAVSDEQDRAAECVGAKFDVERGVKGQALEKIGFGQNQRAVVIEVPVILDDVRYALRRVCDLLGIGDFCIGLVVNLERRFKVAIIVGGVNRREVELDNELMKLRLRHAIAGDLPVSIQPAS